MPQKLAPCGTPAAYRRHHRRGEPVDEACQAAMRVKSRESSGRADDEAQSAPIVALRGAFTAATGPDVDARERLLANMRLVERAMEALADADPLKIVQLSTRHSELVTQLVQLSGPSAPQGPAGEADPFDEFFRARGAAGGATAAPRK